MRKITVGVGIAVAACLVGCNHLPWKRTGDGGESYVDNTTSRPTPEKLVRYLNKNAENLESIRSPEVQLDVRADQSFGLSANLSCMKPRNFRLRASSAGGQLEADFGSNDQEFWYFIKRDNPPNVYFCPHEAMKDGKVRLPIPFQPEMVMAALGMSSYDPAGKYEVSQRNGTIELIENTVSPQGQPLQRVVRFDARSEEQLGKSPRVISHSLRDKTGKEIFTATILDVQKNKSGNVVVAEVPTRFKIAWPAQKLEMTMRLYDVKVNAIDPTNTGQTFAWRDSLKGYESAVNLAQLGTGLPTGIQRTGAAEPVKTR
jgi:hypothetical protein